MKSAKRAAPHKACASCAWKKKTRSPPRRRSWKTPKWRTRKNKRKTRSSAPGDVTERIQSSRKNSKSRAAKADQARGAGVPPAVFLPQGAALAIRSRRLPHWEVEGGVYFVTFRLVDSLPQQALNKILFQRKDIIKSSADASRKLTTTEERRL